MIFFYYTFSNEKLYENMIIIDEGEEREEKKTSRSKKIFNNFVLFFVY